MKRKLLLFAGTLVVFTTAIYIVFLLFDLASGTPRQNEGRAIISAAVVGVLTSVYTVFFTRFFDKKKKP